MKKTDAEWRFAEKNWDHMACRSCGFHGLPYEYEADSLTLNAERGALEVHCLEDMDHRGGRLYLKRAIDTFA